MAKPELIARQSRQPSGWLGEIVARVMSVETAGANRIAVATLAPRSGEAILEIGCGHGRTLARIARARPGFLAGVDPSDVMVRLASRRLRGPISAGRAEVSRATSRALPYAARRFDAALAVHVLYFWPDALADLREIRRVLRPGGRLVLGYRPRDPKTVAALPASIYALRTAEDVEALLGEAGFANARSTEHAAGRGRLVCTEARHPADSAERRAPARPSAPAGGVAAASPYSRG